MVKKLKFVRKLDSTQRRYSELPELEIKIKTLPSRGKRKFERPMGVSARYLDVMTGKKVKIEGETETVLSSLDERFKKLTAHPDWSQVLEWWNAEKTADVDVPRTSYIQTRFEMSEATGREDVAREKKKQKFMRSVAARRSPLAIGKINEFNQYVQWGSEGRAWKELILNVGGSEEDVSEARKFLSKPSLSLVDDEAVLTYTGVSDTGERVTKTVKASPNKLLDKINECAAAEPMIIEGVVAREMSVALAPVAMKYHELLSDGLKVLPDFSSKKFVTSYNGENREFDDVESMTSYLDGLVPAAAVETKKIRTCQFMHDEVSYAVDFAGSGYVAIPARAGAAENLGVLVFIGEDMKAREPVTEIYRGTAQKADNSGNLKKLFVPSELVSEFNASHGTEMAELEAGSDYVAEIDASGVIRGVSEVYTARRVGNGESDLASQNIEMLQNFRERAHSPVLKSCYTAAIEGLTEYKETLG